ncbi:MAG: hypothetical protein ACRDQ5_14690 [Sciscionella sp.]
MVNGLMVGVVLAANDGPGGKGEEFGKSSPVALLVIVLLAIAVVFLVRSMTKHLKRVPASFDPEEQDASPTEEAESPPDATRGGGEAGTKPADG